MRYSHGSHKTRHGIFHGQSTTPATAISMRIHVGFTATVPQTRLLGIHRVTVLKASFQRLAGRGRLGRVGVRGGLHSTALAMCL